MENTSMSSVSWYYITNGAAKNIDIHIFFIICEELKWADIICISLIPLVLCIFFSMTSWVIFYELNVSRGTRVHTGLRLQFLSILSVLVPILMMNKKIWGGKTPLSSRLCIRASWKYLEMKAELLISFIIHLLTWNPKIFSRQPNVLILLHCIVDTFICIPQTAAVHLTNPQSKRAIEWNDNYAIILTVLDIIHRLESTLVMSRRYEHSPLHPPDCEQAGGQIPQGAKHKWNVPVVHKHWTAKMSPFHPR